MLRRTPAVLRTLLGELPPAWTEVTEGPGTWSPFDVVGHRIHGERTDWIPRAESRLRLRVGDGLELDGFQVAPEVFYVPGSDLWLAFSSSGMHVRSMFVDAVARR